MKKICLMITMVCFLFILNGCSIFPDPEIVDINYYDIGFPEEQMKTDFSFNVTPFTGAVGTEPRMIFRKNNNQIAFDSYNRWSFSPAKLVQRYISLSFDDQKISQTGHFISGEVLRFDGDLVNKTANISLRIDFNAYEKNESVSSEIYTVSVPVKEETATSYAEGMEQAMSQIISKIAIQVQKK